MTTYLSEIWLRSLCIVHIYQVRLSPERSQACRLQCSPPVMEKRKVSIVIPSMQLQLQLSDRQRRRRVRIFWFVRCQECRQRVEFSTLDVNLEYINKCVTYGRTPMLLIEKKAQENDGDTPFSFMSASSVKYFGSSPAEWALRPPSAHGWK